MSKTKDRKSYWKLALFPIITFTLFYGLRFGRFIDWNEYEERYRLLGISPNNGDYELLFSYLCHWMASTGIHYQFLILLNVFLVIWAMMWLWKTSTYREALVFIFLVFICSVLQIEQLIRWFFGVSLFIFSICFLLRKKYLYYTIFSICSCLMHIGFLPLVFFFLGIYLVKIKLLSSKLCIILFAFSIILGHTNMLLWLSPYLNFLAINEKTTLYIDSFSSIVTVGLKGDGVWTYDTASKIRMFLAYSYPIFCLNKLIKERGMAVWLANLYSIAIIILPIFNMVEILDRYSGTVILISAPIVIGMSFSHFISNYKNLSKPMRIYAILSFLCAIYPLMNFFRRTDWWWMLFIWDANGRSALPVNLFLN